MKENRQEITNLNIRILLSFLIFLIFINIFSDDYFFVNLNNKTDTLVVYEINKIKYIDLNILISVLGTSSVYKKTQEEFRIENKKNYLILSINSPFYRSGGNIYKMSFAPIYYDDLILFPINSIKNVFSRLLPSNTFYDDRHISISEKSVLRDVYAKGDTINLEFNYIPEFEIEHTIRDLIIFLKKTDLNEKQIVRKSNNGLIRVAEAIYDEKESTVIITFAPEKMMDYVKKENNIIKIIMKKRKSEQTNKNIIKLNTIIIDPGHGGKDPGAIGPTGLKEKNMTLDIAIRLKKLITANYPNIKVIMTRNKDKYVSLKDRTMLANKYPDALFISIHCNASFNKKAKGAETYFLSTAKTDWQRAVEARENASLAFDLPKNEKKGLEFVLWDMAQNEFLKESSHLAELIQGEFEKNSKNPRGLNQAGFYVLKGNYMPAVLVETAFISNKSEEKLLKDKSFRQKIAKNIFNGLKQFIKDYAEKTK